MVTIKKRSPDMVHGSKLAEDSMVSRHSRGWEDVPLIHVHEHLWSTINDPSSRCLVVDELTKTLEKDQGRLAFIYYDFSDAGTQTPLSVVSSLLMQLTSQGTSIPSVLEILYYKLKGGRLQPQLHELTSVLVEVCKDDRPTYVVIDALDECEAGKPSQVILDVMQHLEQASVKLFITSRPHSHSITQQLGNSP